LRDEPRDDADPVLRRRMPGRFSPSCRSIVAGHRSICCSSPIARRRKGDDMPYATDRARWHSDRRRSSSAKTYPGTCWSRKYRDATRQPTISSDRPRSSVAFRPYRMRSSSLRMAYGVYLPLSGRTKSQQQLQVEIARRLAIAQRKEVVLFVHGYNVSFECRADDGVPFPGARLVPASSRGRPAGTEAHCSATTSTGSRPNTQSRTG
jgi:hypothetical protein